MVTQIPLGLEPGDDQGKQAHGTGTPESYKLIEKEIGLGAVRILEEAIDQAITTKSLNRFRANPFSLALEAAISSRYEILQEQWPDMQQEEVLRTAKSYAGRLAAHRKSFRAKPRRLPSVFRTPWPTSAPRRKK